MVPSRANSITACTRLMAAIWPSWPAERCLASVTSAANFTTRLIRPPKPLIGV